MSFNTHPSSWISKSTEKRATLFDEEEIDSLKEDEIYSEDDEVIVIEEIEEVEMMDEEDESLDETIETLEEEIEDEEEELEEVVTIPVIPAILTPVAPTTTATLVIAEAFLTFLFLGVGSTLFGSKSKDSSFLGFIWLSLFSSP